MVKATGGIRIATAGVACSTLRLAVGILAIGALAISLHAQAPDTLWTRTFGGTDLD
ncbi:hypothetical protein LR066_00170 [candidate division WOR-3 bacterium]|nr:hypothetical protein [candidate division WOR-3 bacterium]